jgi:hypothetical protein
MLMCKNCEVFYEPTHPTAEQGKTLEAAFQVMWEVEREVEL